MFSHISLGVNDIEKAKLFYDGVMEVLGSTWKYLEVLGSTWKYLEVLGSTWKYLGLFSALLSEIKLPKKT
jgi:catechol 2,3-dioxygenase-like lactoylglutathione lyase family enzyme